MAKKSDGNKTKPDTAPAPAATPAATPAVAVDSPEMMQQQIIIHAQYVRDMSFENPKAPESLKTNQEKIDAQVGFNIGYREIDKVNGQQLYEVILKLQATGKRNNDAIYITEVEYAGVVSLPGAKPEFVRALLQVEVPRLLFPFARQQLAEMVHNGGHQPLLLPPIDFVGFFQSQLAKAPQNQTAA